MARRYDNYDAKYYVKGKNGKYKVLCGSTTATSNFLGVVCEMNPGLTFRQFREVLTDRTQWIPNHEAIGVVDKYIEAGYGNEIVTFRY